MQQKFWYTCWIVLSVAKLQAQGCSDAGFCKLAGFSNQTSSKTLGKWEAEVNSGLGDEKVFVVSPAIGYTHSKGKHWSFGGKISANYATGNLGSAFGLGDVVLSANYQFNPQKTAWQQHLLLATKLPLSQGNIEQNGLSLPMQYQSSLGTVDLIAGYAVQHKHWLLATAVQWPLTGTNDNRFLPFYWSDNAAKKYPSGNDFNRKADVLLRVNYQWQQGKSWHGYLSALGIYHVAEDTYIDGNISNRPIAINGSKGLTLNLATTVWKPIHQHAEIGFVLAAPIVVRDIRPDGLTRSFSIGIMYTHSILKK